MARQVGGRCGERVPGRRFFVPLPELDESQARYFTGYQHHGVGTALLLALTEVARGHGLTAFVADVLSDNTAMFHSFRDEGLVGPAGSTSYDAGVAHLQLHLPDPG